MDIIQNHLFHNDPFLKIVRLLIYMKFQLHLKLINVLG